MLSELRRKAEEARRLAPGQWEACHAGEGRNGKFTVTEAYVRVPDADFAIAADIVDAQMRVSEELARYIAAASPDVVLALIAAVEAAKAVDRQLSMSACQPDSDEAVVLRTALAALETHHAD